MGLTFSVCDRWVGRRKISAQRNGRWVYRLLDLYTQSASEVMCYLSELGHPLVVTAEEEIRAKIEKKLSVLQSIKAAFSRSLFHLLLMLGEMPVYYEMQSLEDACWWGSCWSSIGMTFSSCSLSQGTGTGRKSHSAGRKASTG